MYVDTASLVLEFKFENKDDYNKNKFHNFMKINSDLLIPPISLKPMSYTLKGTKKLKEYSCSKVSPHFPNFYLVKQE